MLKFVEAVFTSVIHLFNTDTNLVYIDNKQMSYEEYDEEFFIIDVLDIDTYAFKDELSTVLYIDYIYNEAYTELYKTDSEKALEAMF